MVIRTQYLERLRPFYDKEKNWQSGKEQDYGYQNTVSGTFAPIL